jgi:hypothetical protein
MGTSATTQSREMLPGITDKTLRSLLTNCMHANAASHHPEEQNDLLTTLLDIDVPHCVSTDVSPYHIVD